MNLYKIKIEELYRKNIKNYDLKTVKNCLYTEINKHSSLFDDVINKDGSLSDKCFFEFLQYVGEQNKKRNFYLDSIEDLAIDVRSFVNKKLIDSNEDQKVVTSQKVNVIAL